MPSQLRKSAPLSPVRRGEGQGEGRIGKGRSLRVRPSSNGLPVPPSPLPSPPSTGERGKNRRQTFEELRELQRLALKTITRPLAPGYKMQRTWEDGRRSAQVVGEFIKPNDRLTSFERIEIYNKQYWFRVLDCFQDDYPGLRAILGEKKFDKLRLAYLTRYPSASFTLRNLGSRLERFLLEEPHWTTPYEAMALDMARFEWAQVVAFDEAQKPALPIDDLLGCDPTKLRLGLQPYITLLEMGYPLDDFVLAVKKRDVALRSEASNAVDSDGSDRQSKRPAVVRRPKSDRTFIAVHRHENSIYYKRLTPESFTIISALRDGKSLAQACALAVERSEQPDGAWTAQISDWFRVWGELGWFCHR